MGRIILKLFGSKIDKMSAEALRFLQDAKKEENVEDIY